jgi:hypothetical protein
MEELIVTIQEGEVQVEVQGVRGVRCLELTQAIESLLGKISSRKLKNDFYGQAKLKHKIAIRNIQKLIASKA